MGFIRVALALSVVLTHCSGFGGLYLISGNDAVGCFYIISGFYMALILNSKYAFPGGAKVFYLSRALRIWPVYLAILLFEALPLYYFTGEIETFKNLFSPLGFAEKAWVIFSNIFILGQDSFLFFRFDKLGNIFYSPLGIDRIHHNGRWLVLNIPAFTISIEIMFYLIAPFVVKSLRNSIFLLIVGALYHISLRELGLDNLTFNYHFFPAALIYFSLGASAYWISKDTHQLDQRWKYLLAIFIIILLLWTPLLMPSYFLIAFAISVPFIFSKTKNMPFDRSIGDLSFVIYLVHMPIAISLLPRVDIKYLGFYVLPLTITASIFIYLLVERPIEKFRSSFIEKILNDKKRASGKSGIL